MSNLKKCAACKESKPLDSFGPSKSRPDGKNVYCRSCKREKDEAYYAKNREARIAAAATWSRENREASNAAKRKWSEQHPEAHRTARQRWKENNPEVVNRILQRYRANRVFATIGYVPTLSELIDFYGPNCMHPNCDRVDVEIDHVQPLSLGGAHSAENLQLLCRSHNAAKGNRNSADYRPLVMEAAENV